jgi:hypothetical protein
MLENGIYEVEWNHLVQNIIHQHVTLYASMILQISGNAGNLLNSNGTDYYFAYNCTPWN